MARYLNTYFVESKHCDRMLPKTQTGGTSDQARSKDLLVCPRIRGWALARLLAETGLGSQNRDANILTRFDVVRIV